ncbi:Sucrase/ferredoxin-like-domain-containing protein [Chlamydoabsidia padenii]|nr:Sucrase/ferredoxin-like-domain-containing protein [Chlamydoabsidia padenii]
MDWISNQVKQFYTCSPPTPKVSLPPIVTLEHLDPVVPIKCEGCVLPCTSHDRIPGHLNIDQTRSLHNTVTHYGLHLIIFTGRSDWPGHIEDEQLTGALMDCLDEKRKNHHQQDTNRSAQNTFHLYDITNKEQQQKQQQQKVLKQPRVLVTNSSLPSRYSTKGVDILILPDNKIIANVTRKRIQGFVDLIFGQPAPPDIVIHPSPWNNLILVCGHGRKDKRCGTIGPMLQQAFDQALGHYSIENQCQVMLVSHLGGHAFAGNVVLYTHQGLRSIWYGRITPCHCLNIVRYSICQDHVLQEFVRGILQAGSDKENKPYLSLSLEW